MIAAHLSVCADCRRALKREKRTAALLGEMSRLEPRVDAWPAVEAALRSATAPCRRRLIGWQPVIWASGLAATAALTVSLIVPALQPPAAPVDPEPLSALAPRAAAGLVPDRSNDPLIALQKKLDRALDRVADDGS